MTFAPKNILVPVDVDPDADRLLADRLVDDACAIASKFGARLTLLYVTAPIVPLMTPPTELMSEAYRSMLDVLEERASERARILSELEVRARDASVKARSITTTRGGNTPQAIVKTAADECADLIVMTTHGRRGLNRLLLGSVAERTAHLSLIPVLLLPPG